ncbi:hypothetical protein T440DRAFT_383055, partial [Plenodomus tracheiphilus IPT5]
GETRACETCVAVPSDDATKKVAVTGILLVVPRFIVVPARAEGFTEESNVPVEGCPNVGAGLLLSVELGLCRIKYQQGKPSMIVRYRTSLGRSTISILLRQRSIFRHGHKGCHLRRSLSVCPTSPLNHGPVASWSNEQVALSK